MQSFADRVVLITGAANGIGRQLALEMASEGAIIAAIDLKESALAALERDLSGRRLAWAVADVTDAQSLENAVAQLEQQLGPIDLLIANAGIGKVNSAILFSAADFEAMIRVNLIGVANSVAAVLPGMLVRRRGHLVAISSLASFRGLPHMLGYCASKSGVNALMEGLRVELRARNIKVTTICPGWIRTALTAPIPLPPSDLMDLDFAARKIVDAIRREKAFVAFPRARARMLSLLRWLPAGWSDRLTLRAMRRVRSP